MGLGVPNPGASGSNGRLDIGSGLWCVSRMGPFPAENLWSGSVCTGNDGTNISWN